LRSSAGSARSASDPQSSSRSSGTSASTRPHRQTISKSQLSAPRSPARPERVLHYLSSCRYDGPPTRFH
jgi:hypothetical protein